MAEGIVREDLNVTGKDFKNGSPLPVAADENSNPVNWVPTPTHFGNQIPAKTFLANSNPVSWAPAPSYFGNKFGTAGPPVLPPPTPGGGGSGDDLLLENGVDAFLLEDSSGVILLEAGAPPPPPPPVTNILLAQAYQAVPGHASATLTINVTSAQVAGNMNLVAIYWADVTSTITSVTDTKGNTYAVAAAIARNSQISGAVYYAKNIAAGTNVVTVTFNTTAGRPSAILAEYSGLSTTAPLDVVISGSGNGTAVTSGAGATTANPYELIIGAGTSGPNKVFTGDGPGFSTVLINADADLLEHQVVNATGAYAATATMTSGLWIMQMATFKQ